MKKKFRTSDGYTLWWNESMNVWQDNPDAALVDLEFEAGKDGWPIDDCEIRLEGEYID